ncbi:MAG: ABC transporter ATP-binding protein [Nocardiaceae bacterium]|nr:ABC transporter ATP-binding protein [Nocardiaceae bacterium]
MIEVRGLTKHFGANPAVEGLSFAVSPGQVTGFLGPNGAGKSTTMRMILGLDTPTSGRALINGKRYIDLENPLRVVGALLDAKWVHPNRSAHAHLSWLAASNGIAKSRVDEVLGLVGLQDVADKKAGKFSLGMSQRLGLAAAMLGDPQVLMFDEPVNGLDPDGILWIRHFMRRLASEGRTVFVSSHLLTEMSQTADHLIVIGKGKLISDSPVSDFVEGDVPGGAAVRVRSPQYDELRIILRANGCVVEEDKVTHVLVVRGMSSEQIGKIASRNSITIFELSAHQGSLEEAFMRQTGAAIEYHGSGIEAMGGAL